jgi:uncharacterized protein (TIGR00297 family)
MMISMLSHAVAASIALSIGGHGYRKGSLDASGALTALIVGYITVLGGFYETIVLLFFFFSSSKLTKFKGEIKKKREDDHLSGEGHRNWEQVVANGGFPTLLCLLLILLPNTSTTAITTSDILLNKSTRMNLFLLCGYLGTYCSNCSDTWASEVGILSKKEPWFVLAPWRTVPYGTNGGVSVKGLFASFLAGLSYSVITVLYVVIEERNVTSFNILIALFCLPIFAAMFGTILDSVLGALFEYSCYSKRKGVVLKQYDPKEDVGDNLVHISGLDILSGNHTNFLSGVVTGLLTGVLALYLI